MFSRIIYYISTRAYFGGIRLASLWNPKAKKWVLARRNWAERLGEWRQNNAGSPLVWMHCSSLGEYEQGKPMLEAIQQEHPGVVTVVSFFSPSGYEILKDKSTATHLFTALPADTRSNARKFIDILEPRQVLWVKYEYWFHYLNTLRQKKIPAFLCSAVFRNGQPFFKWYGHLWLNMLHCFTRIFVRDEESAQAIAEKGITHVTVNGDTRFDRVMDIYNRFEAVPHIPEFCADLPVVVAGSTWEEDEEELAHFINHNPQMRFIIAPHEIDETHLTDIEKLLKNTVRYSAYIQGNGATANTLIVDNIGMLSRLYNYATIAYVGGGFGHDGVHNVLEAAVYGRPVLFGPVYEKYREAAELIETGGAFSVNSALELEETLNHLLKKHNEYIVACDAARKYVFENGGAVKAIVQQVKL